MTNEELFNDLKQFITATVSQEVASLRAELKADIAKLKADISDLRADIALLDEKLDTIQDGIAEAFTHNAKVTKAILDDHEERLRRLEHRSA